MAKLTAVTPIEYYYKYGEGAVGYYNLDNFRLTRQSSTGDEGRDYVIAAYSILLHNWDIFFEYQFNQFARSICLPAVFDVPMVEPQQRSDISEDIYKWWEWIMDYYSTGNNDIARNNDIILVNEKIDSILSHKISSVVTKIQNFDRKASGYIKIVTTFLVVVTCIASLKKKQWIYVLCGILILGVFGIVILMAPAMRENYYYSTYFNQYWYLFFAGFELKKNRQKIIHVS